MARRSPAKSKRKSAGFRPAKLFLLLNLLLWGAIGGWYLVQPAPRQQEVRLLVGNLLDSRKQVSAFDVAWDLWQFYAAADFVGATPAPGDRTHAYAGNPVAPAGTVRLLANRGYLAGYSDALGNPLWVAYRMKDTDKLDSPPRPDEFRVDPRTAARIEPSVYSRSGYDRGHLAPNYAIATRYGREAQEETFLMSNITPQKHGLNAGLWKELEQKIATAYPARFGEVWVLAGPVFGPQPLRLQRRVAVPEACYMIVVDESEGRVRAQAFLFPQDAAGGSLEPYLTTIDEIERLTGLDFLAALPDAAEAALESRRASRVW